MSELPNLNNVPISSLTYESRQLLSTLLNTKKILPSDGPEKLPRDWRGVASLVNITLEVASSINEYPDKINKVFELWSRLDQQSATVGQLLDILQRIDRFDVYDDLLDLNKKGQLIDLRLSQPVNDLAIPEKNDNITFDDALPGPKQMYHAYVLYADEDVAFVHELLSRMAKEGYKLCTKEELLPGFSTQFAPVAKLISERCSSIILIYSPEFMKSEAVSFIRDYAQAISITKPNQKIIPCMYKRCELPDHLRFYHNLYYNQNTERPIYDFWERLSQTLAVQSHPRLRYSSSSHSSVKITELKPFKTPSNGYENPEDKALALPSVPSKSISMNGLNTTNSKLLTDDTHSLSISQNELIHRKKPGKLQKAFRNFRNSLTGKKNKKALTVES